jgi:hypothetical protein
VPGRSAPGFGPTAAHATTKEAVMARTDKRGTKPTGTRDPDGEQAGGSAPGSRKPEPAATEDTPAAAQTGNQKSTPADTPAADDGHAPAAPEKPALSAFAAAIERKKAAGQARSAHLDGSTKVGGATSNHKTSRTFRRKSG